jgi:hypothetical protein
VYTRRTRWLLAAPVAILAGCSPLLYLVMRLQQHEPRRSIAEGQTVRGNTDRADGERYPTCAGRREGEGDSDNAWLFVAPATDNYELSVTAEYDAVLAISAVDADGEIDCNDDDGSGTDPRLRVRLTARAHYVIVVDGYRGDHGAYSLTVRRGAALTAGESAHAVERADASASIDASPDATDESDSAAEGSNDRRPAPGP